MGGRLLTLIASFFLFCALVAAAGCAGVGDKSSAGPYGGGSFVPVPSGTAGGLPQPASVRLEEYVNDFSYDYPAPTAADATPFTISLGATAGVFNRSTALLRVGIRAFEPPPAEKRPTNLVFLVDVSGSMQSPDKLPLVQRILRDTLEI